MNSTDNTMPHLSPKLGTLSYILTLNPEQLLVMIDKAKPADVFIPFIFNIDRYKEVYPIKEYPISYERLRIQTPQKLNNLTIIDIKGLTLDDVHNLIQRSSSGFSSAD